VKFTMFVAVPLLTIASTRTRDAAWWARFTAVVAVLLLSLLIGSYIRNQTIGYGVMGPVLITVTFCTLFVGAVRIRRPEIP
jgi:hypothetical protein